MAARAAKRVEKELAAFADASDGLSLEVKAANIWHVSFVGAAGTLYAGESFTLKIEFTDEYPMDSPIVVFLRPHVPEHSHIYSNGHICLNILGDDWSPALTAKNICYSILSMLSSAETKSRPPDDESYSRRHMDSNPKKTNFMYHDDSV